MKSLCFRPVLPLLSFAASVTLLPLPAFGQTWTRLRAETTNDLTAVHFADAQHGYIAGAFSTLLKTADGGETWTNVATPASASYVSVAARSATEVFIGRVALYRTSNAGAHWDADVGGLEDTSGSIFDILFTSGTNGFLTKAGAIFATTDGGTQWNLVAATELYLDDLFHPGGQTLFATGGITYIDIFSSVCRGDIARSKDGGQNWEVLLHPEINEIHSAVWENEQTGIVFTFTNKSHRTTDGGDTWQTLTESMVNTTTGERIPDILTDAVIDSTGRIVAVDFGGNFLESADGIQWEITPGSGESFSAITKLPDGSLIAVGNGGHIWKRTPPGPAALPLAIESVRYDAGKHSITLDATGTRGKEYVVQASANLTTWEGIDTVTATDARFSATVGAPSGVSTVYFRIAEFKKPEGVSP